MKTYNKLILVYTVYLFSNSLQARADRFRVIAESSNIQAINKVEYIPKSYLFRRIVLLTQKGAGLISESILTSNERVNSDLTLTVNQELGTSKKIKIAYMISITVFSISGYIIYVMAGQYNRNKRVVADKFIKLKEELNRKNVEISSYTLNFIQKNEIMEELKNQINELRKQSDPTTNLRLTRINRMVDETFRSEDEWETFRLTFEQMHNGFFSTLKQSFPEITNAELKLCALLRLNMNLKESAKILGISPDSVKTARYRLRKKFGLITNENLVDFLIKFEEQNAIKNEIYL
jgi:DNA-binding CsgD family transcriptional regulator